jgi:hypothetical protein
MAEEEKQVTEEEITIETPEAATEEKVEVSTEAEEKPQGQCRRSRHFDLSAQSEGFKPIAQIRPWRLLG